MITNPVTSTSVVDHPAIQETQTPVVPSRPRRFKANQDAGAISTLFPSERRRFLTFPQTLVETISPFLVPTSTPTFVKLSRLAFFAHLTCTKNDIKASQKLLLRCFPMHPEPSPTTPSHKYPVYESGWPPDYNLYIGETLVPIREGNVADLTSLIQEAGSSDMQMEWIESEIYYFFLIQIVDVPSIESIMDTMRAQPPVSKEKTIQLIVDYFSNDTEVQLDKEVIKLIDPLSAAKIKIPARSSQCAGHFTCFDLETSLKLAEQSQELKCPHCQEEFSFEQIVIDDYFSSILQELPQSMFLITMICYSQPFR